ncbi:unnamed protein product, partial [Lepidochelys kempii]
MAERNDTTVAEFIFVGFTDHPDLQIPLFMLFLVMSVVSLMGNLGMIALIMVETQLHTPMYFFLSQMSIVRHPLPDVHWIFHSHSSQAAMTLVAETKTIPFIECAGQLFFVCFFVTSECCLLAVITYHFLDCNCHDYFPGCPNILHVHPRGHSQDPFRQGETQNLFHLHLPPDSRHYVLWDTDMYI